MIGRYQKQRRDGDHIVSPASLGHRDGRHESCHIRSATITDLPAIVTCSNLAFAAFAGSTDEDADDVQLAKSLRTQIVEGSIRLICSGTDILGYIVLWPCANELFVDTLAIYPDHQRRGLGTQLLDFADREAARLGLRAVTLFTKSQMTGNLRFYRQRGYSETGRCNDDGFCRVFYTKAMPPVLAVATARARTAL